MAEAADMISIGDQLNIQIRSNQNWSLLPNFGICSSVAPCLIAQGRSLYPSFPQWLGKNSSARKAKRLIRELKQAMAHRVSADRFAVQNEMVPYLLQEILYFLKKGTKEAVADLISYLDDLNITNDMVKEHLMILTLDTKIHEQFAKISSGTKAAFTRTYNKGHQDIVRKKQEKTAPKTAANVSDSDSDGGSVDVLIDENELADIKKAKQQEKAQKKAERAMKRIDGYNKITKSDAVTPAKGKKRASTASGKAKAKRGSKGTGRKGRDEDVMASDDSLNDFIADDDEEIERVGKRRKR